MTKYVATIQKLNGHDYLIFPDGFLEQSEIYHHQYLIQVQPNNSIILHSVSDIVEPHIREHPCFVELENVPNVDFYRNEHGKIYLLAPQQIQNTNLPEGHKVMLGLKEFA